MGKCPSPLLDDFAADVLEGLGTKELGRKYDRSARTIRRWKRSLTEEAPVIKTQEPSFTIDGNYAVAESTDGRIRTLADLLSAAKVDLSVWKVRDKDGFEIRTWEGYAADVDKDLQYEDGKASGHVKRQGIITTTLWRVKASLVRINPIPVHPIIQPIKSPRFSLPPVKHTKSSGTAMIIADSHFGYSWEPPRWELIPFHDRDVLDIFLQVLEIVQPDVIEFDGDLLDLTVWQDKFLREPRFYQTTQPALHECVFFLQKCAEASPGSEKRVHQGNHSIRMEKTIINHMREACSLKAVDEVDLPPAMSVPKLLGLHNLGVEWVGNYPDDISWLGEHIQVSHGSMARIKPLATVTETLKQGRYHRAVGHIHRDEMVSELRLMSDGSLKQVTGYCPGCACHVDGRVPGSTTNSNWRKGFGIIEWDGPYISITHIPVCDKVAVWSGKRFEARDWVGPLKDAVPEWNW